MAQGKILPYLDIPLQHASPKILKAMKRPGSVERVLERIKKWREICPELTLRSTFIVGFPGETEEDFQMLLDFLKEAQLDRVGCFKFSPVEGAPATEMADQVPEEIKEERFHEIDEEGIIGRSMADAPEIDGVVYVDNLSEMAVKVGDVISVKIHQADEYDLWGTC